jgi:hypothetical protein
VYLEPVRRKKTEIQGKIVRIARSKSGRSAQTEVRHLITKLYLLSAKLMSSKVI